MAGIFQDWAANRGNSKGRLIMVCYRIAHISNSSKLSKLCLIPFIIFYRIVINWILGVEIQHRAIIGPGLKLFHGQALVVHKSTIIGNNCTIRHSTTIGNKQNGDGTYSEGVVIGDGVDIGANCCLIGALTVGDHAMIGAGSVVTKDIPPYSVAVGNPARVIKVNRHEE